MNIKGMIREICAIAVAEGLVDASWPAQLRVKLRKREGRSFGGNKDGAPWINIATPSTWHYSPATKDIETLMAEWGKSKPGVKRDRALARLNKAWHGKAVWCEYPSIAKDPEIGDLVGYLDDKLAPMAALLCHEIAHAIDYTTGTGSGHGARWQRLYRTLRNAYVASGNYKPAPINNVVEFPTAKTKDARIELMGLPLFDAVAA